MKLLIAISFLIIVGCQHNSQRSPSSESGITNYVGYFSKKEGDKYYFNPFFENNINNELRAKILISPCDNLYFKFDLIDESIEEGEYVNISILKNYNLNCIVHASKPIHGGWTSFLDEIEVSDCQSSSDYQIKFKQQRHCIQPPPAKNGRECSGGAVKYHYCSGKVVVK